MVDVPALMTEGTGNDQQKSNDCASEVGHLCGAAAMCTAQDFLGTFGVDMPLEKKQQICCFKPHLHKKHPARKDAEHVLHVLHVPSGELT